MNTEKRLDTVVLRDTAPMLALVDSTREIALPDASSSRPRDAHLPTALGSGRFLFLGDLIGSALAFAGGGAIAYAFNALVGESFQPLTDAAALKQGAVFACLAGFAMLWLDMRGHYRQRLPFWVALGHVLTIAMIGFLICGFLQFASKSEFSRLWLGASWALFALLLPISRGLVRVWLEGRGQWRIPSLLVGSGAVADAARRALDQDGYMGFAIVQQLPSEAMWQLHRPQSWRRLMTRYDAAHLFLALEGEELERQAPALRALAREGISYSIAPPWTDLPCGTMSGHHFPMHDVLLLQATNRLQLPMPRLLKRCFDVSAATCALLVLSPVLLLIAALVRRDGGPALFDQMRVGKGGKTFRCYKFRSMRIDAEAYLAGHLAENPEAAREWETFQKLRHDVRITRFGHFIRRTSIDELPQLLNVLKGEMSLIGPRPILPEQEHYYGDDFVYYESVRPGITGPWQVSGRNALTFGERIRLEVCYARNWSFWMDMVILMKTLPAVLRRDQTV